jgi:hypothetical protein
LSRRPAEANHYQQAHKTENKGLSHQVTFQLAGVSRLAGTALGLKT